ncbi:MAG: hypothetical protein AAF802_28800, partial [Planctomycetota bacterium]
LCRNDATLGASEMDHQNVGNSHPPGDNRSGFAGTTPHWVQAPVTTARTMPDRLSPGGCEFPTF